MHCMPHEIQNVCIGIRLPGAAQLFIFTYAVVWYGLCIYIHRLCNAGASKKRPVRRYSYSITVYKNENDRLKRDVNTNIYYI